MRVRRGDFAGPRRTQTQLALGSTGDWVLVNASPDLRFQIESIPELWPCNGRSSPISGVVMTGCEVDQALGLLLLREFHPFRVHATDSVRRVLAEDNSLFRVLARFEGQVYWEQISLDRSFCASGAMLEAVSLEGGFPGFVSKERAGVLNRSEANIGLFVRPAAGGRKLAFLPNASRVSDDLLQKLQGCDVVLFDGTFWSDDEPQRIPGLGRTALEIGHMPLSGPEGSLARLAALTGPRKMYIHINNTNPILDEESFEYRRVCDCGWEIPRDGMEIEL